MVLLFALAAAIGGFVRRTASLLAIAGAFWVVYRFVITGQLQALGPAETWFGAVQAYVPNLPELAVLVLGLSVAAALIKLGEQMLLGSSQSGAS
jgi:molybdopterin-containing oxidoreductase family membrane subunit